jgi:hypothetical protein
MALKPTPEDIARRKKALERFMREYNYTAQDICELLNTPDNLKPVSMRTIWSWLADPGVASSRTPPENLPEILGRRLAERGRQAS